MRPGSESEYSTWAEIPTPRDQHPAAAIQGPAHDGQVDSAAGQLHPEGPPENAFDNFRALMGTYSENDAALLAYAKGMLEWRKRHRFCGVCGAVNQPAQGGFIMECSAGDCDSRSFPRLDPAIIVLTLHQDRCLLGRQVSWPEGRYSTIMSRIAKGYTEKEIELMADFFSKQPFVRMKQPYDKKKAKLGKKLHKKYCEK